ncbi:MAG: diguanylate cyclase [Rhodospirillales bacterium]|nr:diguanylate cyclase [Rhodospirillales bacterium]MCW8952730.1 diguanylate cyclase [Rhodospirillales bacterium]MCW8971017.1 diguanylate cyclase [Rhodospirillales bacterium]
MGAPSARTIQEYDGPALLFGPDARVTATTRKGEAIFTAWRAGRLSALDDLVQGAIKSGQAADTVLQLPIDPGRIESGSVFHLAIVPFPGEGAVVLGRDMTLERNLQSALIESRQRYKDLVDVYSDFAWEVDSEGRFSFVSPRGALGYEAGEFIGKRPEELLFETAAVDGPLPFGAKVATDKEEIWVRRADGVEACIQVSSVPLTSDDNGWRGARGVCRDVTEDRRKDQALDRAYLREKLLHHIIATIRDEVDPQNILTIAAPTVADAIGAAGCMIHHLDPDGKFVLAAEFGEAMAQEKITKTVDSFARKAVSQEFTFQGRGVITFPTFYRREVNGAVSLIKPAGNATWSEDDRMLIEDVANQLGIANAQVANHERVLRLSRTDGMTGLLNRRAFFEEEIPRRIRRLEAEKETAALMYVDLDNFKLVNDVHGHARGDDAILALRDLLIEHTRPGDAIARLGGDEFALWFDNMGAESAMKRAKAVLKASKALQSFSGKPDKPLGVSLGLAIYEPNSGEALPGLLARADAAMYEVKRHGKGSVLLAPPAGSSKPRK